MKLNKKEIYDNRKFIDEVAIETMKKYVEMKPPTSFEDSMSIARISYKQALAMLTVKKESLIKLAEEQKLVR